MPFAKAFDKQTEALIAFFHFFFSMGRISRAGIPFSSLITIIKKPFVLFCFVLFYLYTYLADNYKIFFIFAPPARLSNNSDTPSDLPPYTHIYTGIARPFQTGLP